MTIDELHEKYHEELSWTMGDQELRYNLLSPLFQNLYENKVLYHERFTCIIQLSDIVISPESFRSKAKRILLISPWPYENRPIPEIWNVGSSWASLRLSGESLAAYSNWVIWTNPVLVKKVEILVQEHKLKEAFEMMWD
ncbi:MAG: hypothetical protein AB9834_00370 [Lentimicrobium sp.]